MKKTLSIVGARPQFIKAFITIKSLNTHKSLKNFLLHTGQHFDKEMSEIFFSELKFKKNLIKINLSKNIDRISRIAEMLFKIKNLVKKFSPDLIIVYGDTDSTLVGSIIARRLNIKLMHIEAGLRSNIVHMPEEQNRVYADYLSDYLICPNNESRNNLKFYTNKKIYNYGDVMYDSFLFYKSLLNKKVLNKFKKKYDLPNKFIFFTVHRDINSNYKIINKMIKDISKSKYVFFWPIHPKISFILRKKKIKLPKNIIYTKPISYLESLVAIKQSQFVVTDSGGVQKEAFFFKKKSFVLRDETEWIDLIKAKSLKIINSNILDIEKNNTFLKSKINKKNYFGNGKSTIKILNLIKKIFKLQ